MSNRMFVLDDGMTELQLDVTSQNITVFTVPAGEKWSIIGAGCCNNSQSSVSAIRISIDGTNYTGYFVGKASPGLPYADIDYGLKEIIIPAGGKIATRSITFTAADSVIHFVLNRRMKHG